MEGRGENECKCIYSFVFMSRVVVVNAAQPLNILSTSGVIVVTCQQHKEMVHGNPRPFLGYGFPNN